MGIYGYGQDVTVVRIETQEKGDTTKGKPCGMDREKSRVLGDCGWFRKLVVFIGSAWTSRTVEGLLVALSMEIAGSIEG